MKSIIILILIIFLVVVLLNLYTMNKSISYFTNINKSNISIAKSKTELYYINLFLRNTVKADLGNFIYNYDANARKKNPVILQSFDQFGNGLSMSSWNSLATEIPYLSYFFNVIWLPPFTKSTGNPGYLPLSYTDFNSFWGSEEELKKLISICKTNGFDIMADVVFHHSTTPDILNPIKDTTGKRWWKTDIVKSSENPDDYISLWQDTNYFGDDKDWGFKDKIIDFEPTIGCIDKDTFKISSSCVPTDKNNCKYAKPLYGIDESVMNAGGLTALNLCHYDILEAQINFLHKLYDMGINNFRYDQLNGISPSTMKLYNNSNINKTADLLKEHIAFCKKVRTYPNCNEIYINQIEDRITNILNNIELLKKFTSPPHNFAVAEAFTDKLKFRDTPPKQEWWTLVGEITAINTGLDVKDYIGLFDFALQSVIKNTFKDNQIIDNSQWKDLMSNTLIGYENQKYTRNGPCLAYTFVSNHDIDTLLNQYNSGPHSAGAPSAGIDYEYLVPSHFILCFLPGYPCILKINFTWFKEVIPCFLILRYMLNVNYNSKLSIPQHTNQDYIQWIIDDNYIFSVIDVRKQKISENNLIFNYVFKNTAMTINSVNPITPFNPPTTST
jgi:glycosidase